MSRPLPDSPDGREAKRPGNIKVELGYFSGTRICVVTIGDCFFFTFSVTRLTYSVVAKIGHVTQRPSARTVRDDVCLPGAPERSSYARNDHPRGPPRHARRSVDDGRPAKAFRMCERAAARLRAGLATAGINLWRPPRDAHPAAPTLRDLRPTPRSARVRGAKFSPDPTTA